MKKKILLCIVLIFIAGCNGALVTPENPLGIDSNQVQQWIEVAVQAGQATSAVGTATTNPALTGAGVLLVVLATALGAGYLKERKK